MATEAPASQSTSAANPSAKKKGLHRSNEIDVGALEQRVHLAELRAREAEADLRYIVATEKRKSLKLEGRERGKGKRRNKGKKRQDKPSDGE